MSPRRPLAGSLVVRLTVSTCVLIVATCIVLSIVLVRRHLHDIRDGLEERGEAISGFVAHEAELGVLSGDLEALRQLATIAQGNPDVVYCRFFDRRGQLLISVGDAPVSDATVPQASGDNGPVAGMPEVWEFQAPISTTGGRQSREHLLADADEGEDASALGASRERVGTVSIGMALGKLRQQGRLAFITAAGFTLIVALLSAASAALLLHGTLRALATAAALTEERGRLAELKVSFVTQASHEFRTPLAVILSCCNVLQRYAARMPPEQQRGRLEKIESSVRHMTELLEDVLTLGHAESGRLSCVRRPIHIATLCEEILADVRTMASESHRLVFDGADCRGDVMVDGKLVRQMLRNLLANAVKYSPGGGTVQLAVARGDGVITFRVADQGIGIVAEDQPGLFEPFHRGTNVGDIKGSGLGLAITRKAVESHGGTIRIESREGHGAVFVVTLPDVAAENDALAVPA
jgi:signal transduction histidine kinase